MRRKDFTIIEHNYMSQWKIKTLMEFYYYRTQLHESLEDKDTNGGHLPTSALLSTSGMIPASTCLTNQIVVHIFAV